MPLFPITPQQRKSVKKIFKRLDPLESCSYRSFRKSVQPTFGCDGAVVVRFAGMWICIERDGYAHT